MCRHKEKIQMVKQKNSKQQKAASVRKAQTNKNTRKEAEPKARVDSKQAEVIGMLRRP
jgi:hypothetical protein